MYTYPPLCLCIRVVVLSFITFISFLWTLLLSFYIFYQWDVVCKAEQSLIVLLLLVNVVTVIVLLVLLIVPFRTWLDAARCMFLLVSHIGLAAAMVYWKPQFQCMATDQDKIKLCEFAATYLLITSWAVPVLIVLYFQLLALMVYHLRRLDQGSGSGALKVSGEEENAIQIPRNMPSRRNTTMCPSSPSVSLASKAKTIARLSKPPRTSFY